MRSPWLMALLLPPLLAACSDTGPGGSVSDGGRVQLDMAVKCSSGVCQTADAGPGDADCQCVPDADVAYVDKQNPECQPAGPGVKSVPYCEIQQAIGKKPYVVVMPSAEVQGQEYQAVSVDSGSTTVVGPGRDAAKPAVVLGLLVSGSAQVVFDGLIVRVGGAVCDSDKAALTLRRSIVESAMVGVKTSPCKQLTVDRTMVRLNNNEGIRIGADTADYVIVNSLIRDNATAGGSGISFDLRTKGQFWFNTVVGNGFFGTPAGAITCMGAASLMGSIVIMNQPVAGGMNGTQFAGACTFAQVVVGGDSTTVDGVDKTTPDFAGVGDYRLKPKAMSANNAACCIDKATKGPAWDYFDTHRPLGAGFDIGFHEVE